MKNWTKEQTEEWLRRNPLPPDFEWQGRRVLPQYRLHGGYGKWLRETPYHRGLFAEIHEMLFTRYMRGLDFPDVVDLVEALKSREEAAKAQLNLFEVEGESESEGAK